MIWQLGILLLLACVVLCFSWLRQDAEFALSLVRQSCKRSGLQWLDQSVQLKRLRWRWRGGPRLGRDYQFDFSDDGAQRRSGFLRLEGPRLLWLYVESGEGAVYLEGQ